jgi:phosphatidylinositol alpha-1,6-mannosyltransferase
MMTKPLLAAVSTEENGGGVSVVARLLWRAFQRRWPSDAQLLRLIEGPNPQPTLSDKVGFTLRLGSARPDWILFSHLGLVRAYQRLPRLLHRPYGVFLHGVEAWCPLPSRTVQLLAAADIRLANSDYTATRVLRAHPGIGPVDVCPLALPEVPEAPPTTEVTERAADELIVLMVGRLASTERYKGHDEVIGVWPRIVAAIPSARLVIVGDGDDGPRLRRRAAESGVEHTIRFTGFVTRAALEECYSRAAIFALPSRGEGFGLVYLEAMAHRLPCVGSVHDAAREIIRDSVTGRLVDQDEPDQLSAAIIGLLSDAALRYRMGLAAYRRLEDEYSFDRFEARLNTILNGAAIKTPQPLAVAAS